MKMEALTGHHFRRSEPGSRLGLSVLVPERFVDQPDKVVASSCRQEAFPKRSGSGRRTHC